ncbi:PucR family transcriptional regulator [Streptomyces sp. WAC 06738]|uniref:helix-turn-helix domain-containing protein n=1 Tax=Streptomyces sp. WAC 06738 TaxID=2203210 RepID=UPI000F6E5A8E|nr:helix-turn-helix domain-containing protein [Streptomyces sp. WAC 06738]AZM45737.1 PucR family transcriptional regulator [Streptomyces sp. WAC 06738]
MAVQTSEGQVGSVAGNPQVGGVLAKTERGGRQRRVGPVDAAEARGDGTGLDGLLREVRRQVYRGHRPDTREVLDWLHRHTGVDFALVAEDGNTVESSTAGFPREILPALTPLLARMGVGQLAAAAAQADLWNVRCETVGVHDSRSVLVAADRSVLSSETTALISHTGTVIALLRRATDGERTWRGFQYKARQVRFGVLSALLAGEPLLARRMTTGAVPPLLEADRLRVHLLHCLPADRDRIVRAYQDPSGYHGPDLMVHCPVFKEHLICLIADDAGAGGGNGQGSGGRTGGLGPVLRRLVRDNPGYAMGVSGPHPLDATAEAYGQAAHALAAARTTSGRVILYQGQTPLNGVLPRRAALAWAHALLRPLDSLPKTTVTITRLLMSMPRAAVARLLDLSRNTVTAHIRRAERALGLDLADVRSRATVHLALALTGGCTTNEPDEPQTPPTLDDLLRTEPAAAWARTFLLPLQPLQRRTLHAWIDANTDGQQAARHLGISRNTVRAHLRTAEAHLRRDLLTAGAGIHDVVHALHISTARAV